MTGRELQVRGGGKERRKYEQGRRKGQRERQDQQKQ